MKTRAIILSCILALLIITTASAAPGWADPEWAKLGTFQIVAKWDERPEDDVLTGYPGTVWVNGDPHPLVYNPQTGLWSLTYVCEPGSVNTVEAWLVTAPNVYLGYLPETQYNCAENAVYLPGVFR